MLSKKRIRNIVGSDTDPSDEELDEVLTLLRNIANLSIDHVEHDARSDEE